MKHDTLSTLAVLVGTKLKERKWMLATAESCTGGWIGQEITAIAGSSDYFDRGFITYSNGAKQELLGVPQATIEKFGAVSEQTAQAMAAGALKNSAADVTVSVTGIAGPGGGQPGKPVGTVCFGWAVKGQEPQSATRQFDGDRQSVRRQSVIFALQGVLERIPQ
ncbi:MAG TPA: nicotinamide-nucleotide amidase [Burkholderiales bacterium]|nr:nicotinamide-nucleotide amidase [Burkholderiales bacterium]